MTKITHKKANEQVALHYFTEIENLKKASEVNFLELAKKLHYVYYNDLVKNVSQYGYDFNNFLDEINMDIGVAYKYIRIWEVFHIKHNIPVSNLLDVGFSKLSSLLSISSSEKEAREAVEYAAINPKSAVIELVRTTRAGKKGVVCSCSDVESIVIKKCKDCGKQVY